jgi:DNA-binding NarL/FixJ family response regulator
VIDVVLIDEHTLVRTAIGHCLEATGEFRVVGEASTPLEGVELCRSKLPRVAVMDCDPNGAVDEILRIRPKVAVVVLTSGDGRATVVRALTAGVLGFLPKSSGMDELVEAIRSAAVGIVHVGASLAPVLVDVFQRPSQEPPATLGLTPREMQVMRLIADGLTSKEVAQATRPSPETIRSYRKAIMRKLDVHNIVQLTRITMAGKRPAWQPPLVDQHSQTHRPGTAQTLTVLS